MHCHPPGFWPPLLALFVSVGTIDPQKKYPLEDHFDFIIPLPRINIMQFIVHSKIFFIDLPRQAHVERVIKIVEKQVYVSLRRNVDESQRF